MNKISKRYAFVLCSALEDKIDYYYEQLQEDSYSDVYLMQRIKIAKEMRENILNMYWTEE